MSASENQICDVCRVLDGDIDPKPCFRCSLCDAWLCEADVSNFSRRLRAAKMIRKERQRGR